MKTTKIIGAALALALTLTPGVNSIIPFTGYSSVCEVSAAKAFENGVYKVTTNTDPLTIRSGAGTNYKKIGSIPKGYLVYAYGSPENNFVKVSYGSIKGWVSKKYLSKATVSSMKPGVYTVKTESTNLNMRINPGTKYEIIDSIKKGTKVNVSGIVYNNRWVMITYNSKCGWVDKSYLSFFCG